MDSAGRKALGWRHGGRASVVRVHHVAPDLPSLRELLELGNYWIYQFFFFFHGIFLMNYADLVGESHDLPLGGKDASGGVDGGKTNHKAVGAV